MTQTQGFKQNGLENHAGSRPVRPVGANASGVPRQPRRLGRVAFAEALEERCLFANPTATYVLTSPTGRNNSAASYSFNVRYDPIPGGPAINQATIDRFDIVSNAGGTVTNTGNLASGNGGVTATYTVSGIPTVMQPTVFDLSLQGNEVLDLGGNSVPASPIGSFVQFPPGPVPIPIGKTSPTAQLNGVPRPNTAGTGYTINITYLDDTGIDPKSIGLGDILVAGPGGFNELGTLVAITNAAKRNTQVQYEVPIPVTRGLYTVTVQTNEVTDEDFNPVQPKALGTFTAGFINPGTGGNGIPTGGGPTFASPDVAAAVTDIPESVATLGKGKVTVRVTNLGDTKTPVRFKIGVFLSDNQILGSADPKIGEFLINRRLDGGQSKSFTVNVKFPDVPAGDYRVAAMADTTGVLKEPNESNNVGFSTGTVAVKVPNVDLAPTFVGDLPKEVVGGDPGRVTLNIANKGTAKFASGANITLYVSADNVLDTTVDPVVRQISGLPLKIGHGDDKNVKIDFNYPTNLADGNYKFIATVDAGTAVDTNLNNNTTVTNGQVFIRRGFFDLRADTISVTSGPLKVGGNNTVEVKVSNLGNVSAKGPLGISLVATSPNLAGQVPLVKVVKQASLGPVGSKNATQKFKITFQLPPTLPSSQSPGYNFQATIDPDQVFAESDETNNVVTTLNPFPTR